MNMDNKMDLSRRGTDSSMFKVEQLSQLTAEAETSIYVADYDTDELLYLNDAAKAVLNVKGEVCPGQKCYEYLMHRTSPCPFCHKSVLSADCFRANVIKFPFNGREYRISSKVSMLGNRKVHMHYITDLTELLNKEKELRALTDKIPSGIGIFFVYPDWRVEQDYLNDGYFAMIGTTREKRMESSGFESLKVIYPDDAAVLMTQVKLCIETNAQVNCDIRLLKENGLYMWLHVRADVYEKTKEKCTLYCAFTDIDELKNALEQQAESRKVVARLLHESQANEKRFKSIMDHVPGAMVVFEVRNKMLWLQYISDSCINITGFTAEETYERHKNDPLKDAHPESKDFFLEHEWENIKNRRKIYYRYQLLCKNGEYKWASLNLSPVEEDDKVYYFGVLRDLDADEQKYQEQENIYNQLISIMERTNSTHLIAKGRYDVTDNKLISYIPKGPESLSLPEDLTFDEAKELMVKTAATQVQGEQIRFELDRKHLQENFRKGKTSGVIEYKRKEVNGEFFWSDLRYTLCMNPDNEHLMFFVYTNDITKKILEQSMLGTLGTTEYEIMGTIDVETHYFETQIVTLSGMSLDKNNKLATGNYDEIWTALANKRIAIYERKQFIEQMQLAKVVKNLEEHGTYFLTYSVLEGDNTYHRKKMQYCFLDTSRETIFFYRSDITETYAREQHQVQETEKALQLAKDANESKTEFFSRMSHDMRTPMNGILGLAGLSMEENDPQVLKTNMSKILESGEYLLSLINDTLDFQRIESGKLKLEPQPYYCRTLIESVLDMVKPSAQNKKINFKVINHNTDWDCYLMIDPVRSRQIFVNLLSNAIKFTPSGGTISVECEVIKRTEKGVYDRFIIRDTGVGMSEDFVKNKLFHPFSQENNPQSIQYAGSGLGLSIVHSLVEMMGGKIEVESELGTGTAFIVYLEFERVENENVMDKQEKMKAVQATVSARLHDKRVLLAEDHPLNAEIARKLLEKVGCIVTWVKNGEECVEHFAGADKNQYDIILMDIRMPIMDGLTAARNIRAFDKEEAKTIPILAMTANAYDEDVKKSMDAGMNGHLSKPIVPATMYEAIASAIEDSGKGAKQ